MKTDLLFGKFPHLEMDDIILKKVEDKDLNDLFEILTNAELFKYRPGKPLKNMDAVKNVIGHYERDFKKQKTIFLGIFYKAAKNKMTGIAEIFDFNNEVNSLEIGYTLNQNYWGKGIATKATAMMLDFLFNKIEVNRIQATPMPVNEKSQNVLKRNGFIYEGTLRQVKNWTGKGVVDLTFYSILKSEYGKAGKVKND